MFLIFHYVSDHYVMILLFNFCKLCFATASNFNLAVGENSLELSMQKGMLDKKPDGTGYYGIKDWAKGSFSIYETVISYLIVRIGKEEKLIYLFDIIYKLINEKKTHNIK